MSEQEGKQKELEAALSSVIAQLYELNPGLVPFYTNQAGNILAQWGSIQGNIQAQTDLMNLINQIQDEIDSISGGGSAYVLPTASTTTLGGVKIDGTSITIQDGTISADIPTNTSDLTNDSGFITNSVNNLTNYTLSTNLATVATSGSYDDLADKPTIVTSYNDLTDKPSIPEAYTLPTASTTTLGGVKVDGTTVTIADGVITAHATSTGGTSDYTILTNKPQIGGVELTGNKSLSDLGIQPAGTYLTEIPAEYVTETELNGKGYLTAVPEGYVTDSELEGKGYITSAALGGYAQTSDIPTATSDLTNDSGFITNSVNNLTNYTLTSGLATVATSGSYNDLTDKPSIPTAYTLPTASTTVLGGVKVDGATVTVADGVISSTAKPGANFYIYGNSGVPDISPAASNLIPVSRFQNYDLNNSRLQVGDILIDLEGTIAYVTSVNSGPTDPNSWTFNVTDDSIVIKLQTRTDETLTTTDKTIVGAINELLSKIEALEARVTALETPTT